MQERPKRPAKRPVVRRDSTADRGKREQTKFDKWLLQMRDDSQIVDFVLDPSPYPPGVTEPDEIAVTPARIVEVDRYFILIEFSNHVWEHDGAVWWIPKGNIQAASHSPENVTKALNA